MKVYISGKIGEEVISEATRRKFAKAEEILKATGFETFNPTTSGLGAHAESLAMAADYKTSFYQEILLCDLAQLAQCDAIYMLADWSKSNGANVELSFAMATDKRIFWEQEEDAKAYYGYDNYDDVWIPLENNESQESNARAAMDEFCLALQCNTHEFIKVNRRLMKFGLIEFDEYKEMS